MGPVSVDAPGVRCALVGISFGIESGPEFDAVACWQGWVGGHYDGGGRCGKKAQKCKKKEFSHGGLVKWISMMPIRLEANEQPFSYGKISMGMRSEKLPDVSPCGV